jgi:hypothetical protein
MHSRTTAARAHWRKQHQQLQEQIVALEQAHHAPPCLSLETPKYVENADQELTAASLEIEAPLLFQMQMTILVANDEIGFLTSDTPCIWFNPNLYKFPPAFCSPGLGHKDMRDARSSEDGLV